MIVTDVLRVKIENYSKLPLSLQGQSKIGMHIIAICKFLADHQSIESDRLTTLQINSAIIKPETKRTGEAYIQLYASSYDDTSGKPLVAAPSVFVSHASEAQSITLRNKPVKLQMIIFGLTYLQIIRMRSLTETSTFRGKVKDI